MKKLTALLLAILTLFCFTACGVTVESAKITAYPEKLTYIPGKDDTIDLTGMTYELNYSDGTSKTVSADNAEYSSNVDFNKEGSYVVSVKAEENTMLDFAVQVLSRDGYEKLNTEEGDFCWEKDIYENCGTYPSSVFANRGIVVGDENNYYYQSEVITSPEQRGPVYTFFVSVNQHIIKNNIKTGQSEDVDILWEGDALTQMNYYKGNLYCMYEGVLYCYTPETGGATEITGVDNGVIVDGKMFCIDVVNEKKRLGNLCFTDLATFEDVEVATGVYSRFIYFNDEKVYYSVKTNNGYDVFAYDVKLQESELLKTVDAAPCHMLGEMVICKEKYGNYMYGEDGKRPLIASSKYVTNRTYKNIEGFFGNGNMLFFTMRRGVDQEEQGLDLYAYCTDNEEYYYLGIVPDPHLTILGETLCCYSAHKYGNVSLVNFVDGKAAVTPLKCREPYPYGY